MPRGQPLLSRQKSRHVEEKITSTLRYYVRMDEQKCGVFLWRERLIFDSGGRFHQFHLPSLRRSIKYGDVITIRSAITSSCALFRPKASTSCRSLRVGGTTCSFPIVEMGSSSGELFPSGIGNHVLPPRRMNLHLWPALLSRVCNNFHLYPPFYFCCYFAA